MFKVNFLQLKVELKFGTMLIVSALITILLIIFRSEYNFLKYFQLITMSLVIIIILIISLVCYYEYKNFNFWKKRNVKGPDPKLFFGNIKSVICGKEHLSDLTKHYYDLYKEEKMVGLFALNSPILILRDLNLIKDVLVKDSSMFSDRGIHVFDTVEPLSQHIFNLPHTIWQPLRSQLDPAFRGNKEIIAVALDIAEEFVHFVEKETLKQQSLDCFSLFGKYMTEVIAQYGFELKLHQFENNESEFQKLGKKRQQSNVYNFMRRFFREYFPKFYQYSSVFIRNNNITTYFVNMLQEIEKYRKSNNVCKQNFVGRLLNLKNLSTELNISDKLLAAQAYVLFTAGADTSSVIISNGLYELAMNEIIQEKLRNEISKILTTNNLTKKDFINMPYLDSIYKEVLRKYTLRNIIRRSSSTYTFKGTNITIPENIKIIIPHYAIHNDPEYYSDPELFDPNRFFKQDFRHSPAYLPFGNGPRYCIGKIWAEYIIKIVIAKIIVNFDITIDQEFRDRKKHDPRKVFLWPIGGIHLKFSKRRF